MGLYPSFTIGRSQSCIQVPLPRPSPGENTGPLGFPGPFLCLAGLPPPLGQTWALCLLAILAVPGRTLLSGN